MMKTMLVIMVLPMCLAVFKGLWSTQDTQKRVVVDAVEIGAEYAQRELKKARKAK